MNSLLWFWAALGLLLAAIALGLWWHERRAARRTLMALDRMLDEAMSGGFSLSTYDESLLSSVEAKMAHYLDACALSARTVAEEKDTIKALLADLSHQTKTPIANLLLYSSLLQEQPLPPLAAEQAARLTAQAQKLQFLIDALVKLSRLETGVLTLHPQLSPVSPVIEAALAQIAPSAAEKKLSLCYEESNAQACFDPKWTEEALYNLLDNAVKYTAQGHVRVFCAVYESFCCISVQDTGIGVTADEQSRVFARFYRSPRVAQQSGVGIGLYLTRQIVQRQGGYLKVSTSPDGGSVFSMFLPRRG